MKAVIFTGGSIKDYTFCNEYIKNSDLIVCCDSGMEHTKKLNIIPDYIVGDFDSVSKETFDFYKELNVKTYKFPTEKDETDTQLGIDVAVLEGAIDIVVIGGIGSRFDHTLANAHLLLGLVKKDIRARLVNENNCVELLKKSSKIYGKKGDLVSTIPLSMVVYGLTLKGFMYPLENRDLYIDDNLVAVSNVLTEEIGEINFSEGFLFVIKSKDL